MSALFSVGRWENLRSATTQSREGRREIGSGGLRSPHLVICSGGLLLKLAAAARGNGERGFCERRDEGRARDDVGKRSRVRKRGHRINATEWQAGMGRMCRGPAVFQAELAQL
jgi:hypothetical protein